MITQYTPLTTDDPDFGDSIINASGERIAEVTYGDYIERVYIARRIVACVNACAGIPTPALETMGFGVGSLETFKAVQQQRDDLAREVVTLTVELGEAKQQHDELLAALESIAEYWNRDQNETAMSDACWHAVNTAEEAIAKARGSV